MPDDKILIPRSIPLTPVSPRLPVKPAEQNKAAGFGQILEQQIQKGKAVQFSQHALQRLELRNIHLTDADYHKINQAVDKAAGKGAKESLVLLDNRAFVVSVRNRTVITVVDEANLKENVFTNIDSAVIM